MPPDQQQDQSSDFERELLEASQAQSLGGRFVLRLYVAGTTPRSTRALRNIRAICEEHLKDRYELEVIDIYQQPELASSANLLAAPTLVRELPEPMRRMIGDFSNTEKVLVGLNIFPAT